MNKDKEDSLNREKDIGQKVISGGMLQVNGLGVLIRGDSGVGKSESALELISRGWRFVSDDVTNIKKMAGDKLMGTSPAISRYFMEIRGLGIINIKQIFGSKYVCKRSKIDLIINLKRWEQDKEYDRLGLELQEKYELLGVKIPQIIIPVAPGRNIATLIEVACKVQILRGKGYHAPQEISNRIDRDIALKTKKTNKDK
jgi:HPr kinase/phosphorylase